MLEKNNKQLQAIENIFVGFRKIKDLACNEEFENVVKIANVVKIENVEKIEKIITKEDFLIFRKIVDEIEQNFVNLILNNNDEVCHDIYDETYDDTCLRHNDQNYNSLRKIAPTVDEIIKKISQKNDDEKNYKLALKKFEKIPIWKSSWNDDIEEDKNNYKKLRR